MGFAPSGEEEGWLAVGVGAALGLALPGAAGFPLGEGDWGVAASPVAGGAEGDLGVAGAETGLGPALASAAAPPEGAPDTGVPAAWAVDDVELTPFGDAADFGSAGVAACPADSEAGRAPAWDSVDVLTPMNCSGPALARISFT